MKKLLLLIILSTLASGCDDLRKNPSQSQVLHDREYYENSEFYIDTLFPDNSHGIRMDDIQKMEFDGENLVLCGKPYLYGDRRSWDTKYADNPGLIVINPDGSPDKSFRWDFVKSRTNVHTFCKSRDNGYILAYDESDSVSAIIRILKNGAIDHRFKKIVLKKKTINKSDGHFGYKLSYDLFGKSWSVNDLMEDKNEYFLTGAFSWGGRSRTILKFDTHGRVNTAFRVRMDSKMKSGRYFRCLGMTSKNLFFSYIYQDTLCVNRDSLALYNSMAKMYQDSSNIYEIIRDDIDKKFRKYQRQHDSLFSVIKNRKNNSLHNILKDSVQFEKIKILRKKYNRLKYQYEKLISKSLDKQRMYEFYRAPYKSVIIKTDKNGIVDSSYNSEITTLFEKKSELMVEQKIPYPQKILEHKNSLYLCGVHFSYFNGKRCKKCIVKLDFNGNLIDTNFVVKADNIDSNIFMPRQQSMDIYDNIIWLTGDETMYDPLSQVRIVMLDTNLETINSFPDLKSDFSLITPIKVRKDEIYLGYMSGVESKFHLLRIKRKKKK